MFVQNLGICPCLCHMPVWYFKCYICCWGQVMLLSELCSMSSEWIIDMHQEELWRILSDLQFQNVVIPSGKILWNNAGQQNLKPGLHSLILQRDWDLCLLLYRLRADQCDETIRNQYFPYNSEELKLHSFLKKQHMLYIIFHSLLLGLKFCETSHVHSRVQLHLFLLVWCPFCQVHIFILFFSVYTSNSLKWPMSSVLFLKYKYLYVSYKF